MTVALLGSGPLGRRTLELLLARGSGRVCVATLPSKAPETWILPAATAHPGGQLATATGPEAGPGWEHGWLGACDFCVLALDHDQPWLSGEVNRACLGLGIPLLPAIAMGPVGQLGPWNRHGKDPCLRCLELRIEAAARRPAHGAPLPPEPAVCEILARHLAEQAMAFKRHPSRLEADAWVHYLWADGSRSRHPVMRSPSCPDCGPRGPFMAYRFPQDLQLEEREAVDRRRILKLRERLVDPLTGLVRGLQATARHKGAPDIHLFTSEISGLDILGGGVDAEEDLAIAAALGESVERAAATAVIYPDLTIAPFTEVADEAVDPLAWDLFHPETRQQAGFPFRPLSREAPISWAWGYSLTRQRPLRLPAARVFPFFQALTPDDEVDFPLVSGFAAGYHLEEAILAALLEVLERDLFMIAWANRLPMRRLEISAASPSGIGDYVRRFEASKLRVACAALRLDVEASLVVGMLRSDAPGEPAMVISTAACLDLADGCRRALRELALCRELVCHEMARRNGQLPRPVAEEVIDMRAHGLLYARPEMARHLDIWWDSGQREALPEPSQSPSVEGLLDLLGLVDNLRELGLEVLAVDMTPPEIRDLGLAVARVLVPGTYPVTFDSRWPHFGGRRIYGAPVRAGLRQAPLDFAELNRIPHPFP